MTFSAFKNLQASDNVTICVTFWINQGKIVLRTTKKSDRWSKLIDQQLQQLIFFVLLIKLIDCFSFV